MKKFLLLVIVLLIAIGYYFYPKPVPELVTNIASAKAARQTGSGPVIGFEDANNTLAWLGIPFARPPVNELRWRAPRAAEPWQEQLETIGYNNACVQLWGPLSGESGAAGEVVGNEDCLYLNVWAPATGSDQSSEKLPVMLWIHGGGNTIGTANTYPASVLAGGENVVVVTINYRLGLLGWMSHPALRGSDTDALDGSGNYGILDMIAALAWVQSNIANFGGDPENVTIFGESAGGRNVYSLLVSPLAKGLFHKAIAQSGSIASTPRWHAENYRDDEQPGTALSSREWLAGQLMDAGLAADHDAARAAQLLMTDPEILAFMHARTPQEILAGALREGVALAGMYNSPQNIRDGSVLPQESILSRLGSLENYNSVPLMTGTNRDEYKLFMAQDPAYIEKSFCLFPRIKNLDAYNADSAYGSDFWKASSVDAVANLISRHPGQSVYAYRWDWDEGTTSWGVDYAKLIGAGHGIEVSYVFGDFGSSIFLPGFYTDENISGRDMLSRQMRSYWAEFARSGNPGKGRDGELSDWQAWQNDEINLMLLDTAADGGLRMVQQPMTVAMLKDRLQNDPRLSQQDRCAIFSDLFFKSNTGDDYWDADEFASLGCDRQDPWDLQYFFK